MKDKRKRRNNRRRKRLNVLVSISIILILLIAILSGAILFYKDNTSAVSNSSEEVTVKIDSGMGAYQVIDRLDEKGLIKNKKIAKIYAKLNNINGAQANTYLLNKNMSLSDIFDILENPDEEHTIHIKFTVKDGNTIPQVAQAVAELLDIPTDDVLMKWEEPGYLKSLIDNYWFIDESILNENILYPLEGYLYPETYYILEEDPTIENVTKYALDMMNEKLSEIKDSIGTLGFTPHEFLSFASVVERESLFDKDKAKIAGVLMNRLDTNMKLQVDCTVNYAWQRTDISVSYDHLDIDSKYNTYKYEGLPVGPISTVTLDTMKSCVDFDHNDYLYFFAKEDGTVLYSKTLEEHEKNIEENKWY